VQAAALPRAARVEIEVVARLPGGGPPPPASLDA
jgi:hypothetical protein